MTEITTQEKNVRGKLDVHYDFDAMLAISFALSVGFHFY